jgi:hypothetical protein
MGFISIQAYAADQASLPQPCPCYKIFGAVGNDPPSTSPHLWFCKSLKMHAYDGRKCAVVTTCGSSDRCLVTCVSALCVRGH